MLILKGRKGNNTYTLDPNSIKITINGLEISGFAYDEWFTVFGYHKFEIRGGRRELFVKDCLEGRKIFTDISAIMEKHIDIIPSKESWLRVRPAFNDKEVKMIKNYFKMVEEA